MTDKIIVKNLHKSFGAKHVLKGIDLEIKKGESLVVIGGSGTGKSVLIKSIIGLLNPDNGSVLIDGEEITNLSGKKHAKVMQKFGYLFQGGALFDSLPIWKNIAFVPIQNSMMSLKAARKLAIHKLESVGLDGTVADLYPAELSGGMQKRAALARAIALDPEIIFFDEPTTGLDPIMSAIINDLIKKNSKQLGATTITITHDLISAAHIADRIAMLYEGKLVWQGPMNKLHSSGNPYVEQFVSGSVEGPIKIKIQDH
ncbi:MAG: ATP-binding cassette domain-containing protein [Rickettsiales bacterium]|jgi:phospholipid/cholesterol/gamma-HCH transport system ATP-binding protein|nr:ATP-binding cassette domain-containing protein [Rickettsiales bacterium]